MDVFISYRRSDGATFAESLSNYLKENGFSVFFDASEIKGGQEFPKRLISEINNCNDFIMICSNDYLGKDKNGLVRLNNKGDWVKKEIELALKKRKRIIPVLVDGSISNALEFCPSIIKKSIEKLNFITYTQGGEKNLHYCFDIIIESFTEATTNNREIYELTEKLENAPDEMDKSFSKYLTGIVIDWHNNNKNVDELLSRIMNNHKSQNVRFAAYYSVFSYYRRYKFTSKLVEFIESNYCNYSDHAYNKVIMTQYYKHKYNRDNKAKYLEEMLGYSRECLEIFSDQPGVLHSYSDSIAFSLEAGFPITPEELDKAICIILRIIEETQYSRYYCTYGRLLCFKNRIDEAIMNINKAIDYENTTKNDAYIRIVEYKEYIINAKLRELQKRTEELEMKLKGDVAHEN